jgi:hypothetical protein
MKKFKQNSDVMENLQNWFSSFILEKRGQRSKEEDRIKRYYQNEFIFHHQCCNLDSNDSHLFSLNTFKVYR